MSSQLEKFLAVLILYYEIGENWHKQNNINHPYNLGLCCKRCKRNGQSTAYIERRHDTVDTVYMPVTSQNVIRTALASGRGQSDYWNERKLTNREFRKRNEFGATVLRLKTPRSRAFLEKLIVAKLANKFFVFFCYPKILYRVHTRTCQWSPSWPRWIQPTLFR